MLRPPFAALTLSALLGACAGDAGLRAGAGLPVLTTSDPVLEIGVLDGAPEYTFGAIESVLTLPGGSIVVSDGQNNRISVYDSAGIFVRSWGTRGDGPGEFRRLSRLYLNGPDTLYAADGATGRLSAFDPEGDFVAQLDDPALSGDSTFALDSWLYGRFWVDGALGPADRAAVRAALDGVPPPRSSPGYRSVTVSGDGDLWIREPGGAGGSVTWLVLDQSGAPTAWVDAPSDFEPREIGADEVLGVWSGESGVHFVREYRIVETGEDRPPPEWLLGADGAASGPSAEAPGTTPDDTELLELIRSAIRGMASQQEIHYSTHYTYTTELDSLDFEQPEGLEVSFTHADARGWSAVFAHSGLDRICGLAYGAGAPPGWSGGRILCAPSPSAPGSAR